MSVKQVKVDISDVTVGMFVSGLDRPWGQTPFPLQGFYIRELDEINELKIHCKHVFIDVEKGPGLLRAVSAPVLKRSKTSPTKSHSSPSISKLHIAPLRIRRNHYTNRSSLKKEVTQARSLYQKVFGALGQVVDQLDAGNPVKIQETKRAASELVDSIIRNPDAFAWLTRVKEADEHTYTHALRSAVWGMIFGRHIGLLKKEMNILAMALLLKDIGKVRLSKELIQKTNRSPDEQKEYEKFVEYGVNILRKIDGVEPKVIGVVKAHCERVNGGGFPAGLRGDKIPLLAKVAGIVTFYDKITHPRGEAYPLSPSKAVAELYDCRDHEFQEELVVEFIRGIGIYPTGTLVELNTGEVGLVVEQNFERRLKPQVLILLDPFKQPLSSPTLLDLAEDDRAKQSLVDEGKIHWREMDKIEISQDLEVGSYDIDIARVRDEYLFKDEKKKLFGLFRRG